MDKEQKALVELSVRETIQKLMGVILTKEEQNEEWLTSDELTKFFHWAPSWITRYGQFLPRTKPDGGVYLYPKHQIQRMFRNGEIKCLTK